jgi:hypothetical protein
MAGRCRRGGVRGQTSSGGGCTQRQRQRPRRYLASEPGRVRCDGAEAAAAAAAQQNTLYRRPLSAAWSGPWSFGEALREGGMIGLAGGRQAGRAPGLSPSRRKCAAAGDRNAGVVPLTGGCRARHGSLGFAGAGGRGGGVERQRWGPGIQRPKATAHAVRRTRDGRLGGKKLRGDLARPRCTCTRAGTAPDDAGAVAVAMQSAAAAKAAPDGAAREWGHFGTGKGTAARRGCSGGARAWMGGRARRQRPATRPAGKAATRERRPRGQAHRCKRTIRPRAPARAPPRLRLRRRTGGPRGASPGTSCGPGAGRPPRPREGASRPPLKGAA